MAQPEPDPKRATRRQAGHGTAVLRTVSRMQRGADAHREQRKSSHLSPGGVGMPRKTNIMVSDQGSEEGLPSLGCLRNFQSVSGVVADLDVEGGSGGGSCI